MSKKKIVIIGLVILSVLVVIALPFISTGERVPAGVDRVAVIHLNGTIQESLTGFMGGVISPQLVYNQLQRVADDVSIKGVVLRIESPGGSIAASQEIASMIRYFEKPIVISMGDTAASGGYYISAYAQGIVAQPGTMTGSIGVISTIMNLEKLYDKLGIEVEIFKSGRHKDMLSRTPTDEEREIMQMISDEAYDQFVNAVAEGRGLEINEVRKLATGQIYLGAQAKELGLVDRLGGLEEAIDYLAELNNLENPVRFEFAPPSIFNQLLGFSYEALVSLRQGFLPSELMIFDRLQEGITPDVRYQLR